MSHDCVFGTTMNYAEDRPVAANPVKVMDLSLRDGHQSLFATRGRTEDMLPVAEMMDEVGFWAVEVWGGATFDTMHRFLNEDPWQRLRTLKKYFKKTPFSMLLRGQNLVGYRNYADDVAKTFVERAAENGMDVFRTFDALNDYRNFETVSEAILKAGKHFQGCICYTMTEPRMGGAVYNLEYFVNKAKHLAALGVHSICIKDMAGLLAPYDAYELIKAIKATVKLPLHLHSHFTSGMASMTQLKAIEAGVDIVDTCMTPYAFRTSHPAIEPLVMTLLGTNRDTGFDIKKLAAINEVLERDVMPKYKHLLDTSKVSIIDINVLLHQTPGGMLSNLVTQLKEMDALDRLAEVFQQLPIVRKELGQIPLVTPTSQIVGVQTVNNVLHDTDGDRYKMITGQVKDLCFGLYGKTAIPISSELQKKALHGYPRGETPIDCRPASILEPELVKAKEEIGSLAHDIEDLLTFTLFPVTGRKFLEWKYGHSVPPDSVKPISLEEVMRRDELLERALNGELITQKQETAFELTNRAKHYNVVIDGEQFSIAIDEQLSLVQSTNEADSRKVLREGAVPSNTSLKDLPISAQPTLKNEGLFIVAPMPGLLIRYLKHEGDKVSKGEPVVLLEAMKMENALTTPCDGIMGKAMFSSGDSVGKNAQLCAILC